MKLKKIIPLFAIIFVLGFSFADKLSAEFGDVVINNYSDEAGKLSTASIAVPAITAMLPGRSKIAISATPVFPVHLPRCMTVLYKSCWHLQVLNRLKLREAKNETAPTK